MFIGIFIKKRSSNPVSSTATGAAFGPQQRLMDRVVQMSLFPVLILTTFEMEINRLNGTLSALKRVFHLLVILLLVVATILLFDT